MAEKLAGLWKQVISENMEEWMKDAKVGLIVRKLAKTLTVSVEIHKDSEEEWTVNYLHPIKDHKTSFKLNDRFRTTTGDGRDVWATYRLECDKMVFVEEPVKDDGTIGNEGTIELLVDGRLFETVTTVPNGISLKRWYTPVKK